MARAQRNTARLASVAVCVICQNGRPNSFASFSPTRATRSAGNIEVMPHRAGLGQRARDRGRRVAEHRAGVAETEIDVGVAVDVFELDAARLADEQRMRRAPVAHPVHRHAVQPMCRARLREPRGFGVRRGEASSRSRAARRRNASLSMPGRRA